MKEERNNNEPKCLCIPKKSHKDFEIYISYYAWISGNVLLRQHHPFPFPKMGSRIIILINDKPLSSTNPKIHFLPINVYTLFANTFLFMLDMSLS